MNDPILTKRFIRRNELRKLIPVADTTIYELERAGNFPKRFNLTARCVVWDLEEIEEWIAERRAALTKKVSPPDVRQRKTRPVRRDT
ncbi:helix-turn-helix transcriptional regulator [Denitratisoma oestradiolicum]|uniref:AlpA family phage regulatory protein n=1 Tax=Denitratisoma oestradiolicum TaxID=311182 RepID=A0A6S6XT71_9PROT|nr:AlpA family phage regulatory protein [Denitratisoma oestradiolicum]CAB1369188.1 conserved protein of unknown function [Denitratisoma oestradiolicum]